MSMHTDTNDLRATCRDLLEPLVAQTVGIDSAAVVTSDGFELASVLRAGVSAEKLAAMVSSLLALSEAVAGELAMGRCRYVIVDTECGSVITLRIPAERHELLMSVLCGNTATLGAVLYAARDCAHALAARLPTT